MNFVDVNCKLKLRTKSDLTDLRFHPLLQTGLSGFRASVKNLSLSRPLKVENADSSQLSTGISDKCPRDRRCDVHSTLCYPKETCLDDPEQYRGSDDGP